MHHGEITTGRVVWVVAADDRIVEAMVEAIGHEGRGGADWWCVFHDEDRHVTGGGYYSAREMYTNREFAVLAAAEAAHGKIARLTTDLERLKVLLAGYQAELRRPVEINGDGI